MRVHVLQHAPFEGLGSIRSWLDSRSAGITTTRPFAGDPLPPLHAVDWVVALGGPMSVNDEAEHSWLVEEKRFVADAIAGSKVVLGICLGAQLVASALGAKVTRGEAREIGWHPIEPVSGGEASPFADLFATPMEVFHWHGEVFELPAGAMPLARSAACACQAFSLHDRVLALQFHLETTFESVGALIEHCPEDLAKGPWVQSGREMLQETGRFPRIHRVMADVLDRLETRGG